jgi:hypothetical protein
MKDYHDIINRKTYRDNFSDALNKQADSIGRPMNKGQADTSAILRGFAAGFSHDSEREAKLAELENMSKELAMNKYALEMQSGKNAKIKADNENFFLSNRNDLATLNDFLQKGDFEAVNVMAPTLLENYKKITGKDIGEYAYSSGGKIYVEDSKGNVKGQYIADILQGIIPQEEQMNFPELLTYNSKAAVQNKLEEQRLKNEQIKAAIEASRANVETSKAHAELYKSQAEKAKMEAEKAKMEAENPMSKKEQETILTTNITSNRKYIEEKLDPKLEASENILTAYDRLGKIAIETPNLVGSDYLTKVRRTLGEVFGLDPNLDYAKLSNVDFEKMLRPILGAQFTKDEGNRILAKLPSIEKNRKALLQFLKEDRPKLIKSIVKMKAQKNIYNKNNAINILDENQLGNINNDYNMFVKDRYGIEQDNLNLVVDNNSKEYNTYKNKGATGN